MTSKQKAEQLYKRFQDSLLDAVEIDKLAIQDCALIAVDEISYNCYEVMKPFWNEVKQEIENL